MSLTVYTERDLTEWDIANHLKWWFESNGAHVVGDSLFEKGLLKDPDTIGVVVGEKSPVSKSGATIRIVPVVPKKREWMATRVTKDIYTTYVDCIIRIITNKEVMDEFIGTFASMTQNWLNRIDDLQFVVRNTNVRVYDSWTNEVEYGFSKEGALRIGRLTHMCWVANLLSR